MPRYDVLGTVLAYGVPAIGLALGLFLWLERQRRPDDLSADDVTHFRWQEIRRLVVSFVMVGLGVLLFVGTRTPPQIGRRPNMAFVTTWIVILGLVVLLLVLATLDWLATRRYARRHRLAIVREGMALLRDEMHRRTRDRDRERERSGSRHNGTTPTTGLEPPPAESP